MVSQLFIFVLLQQIFSQGTSGICTLVLMSERLYFSIMIRAHKDFSNEYKLKLEKFRLGDWLTGYFSMGIQRNIV